MRLQASWAWLGVAILAVATVAVADDPATTPKDATWPGMTRAGSVLLPNGWSLKPAGRQVVLGDFPVLIAENPATPVLAILHAGYGEHEILTLDARTSKILGRVTLPYSFSGLVWSGDGTKLYAGGGFDDILYGFDHKDGLLSNKVAFEYPDRKQFLADPPPAFGEKSKKTQRCPAGLAISKDGKTLYSANAFGQTVASFDTESRKLIREVPLGDEAFPYTLAIDEGHDKLYVSLWGQAKVAILDLKEMKVSGHYETQEHPNEMILARKGDVLFVANANRNTVTVIDVEKGRAVETINTAIDPKAPSGSTPSSLALSTDESILFVGNANTNDVAAFNVKGLGASTPLGFIPVGWYPTSVRVSRDNKTLWVANGKGGTSKANRDGPRPDAAGGNATRQYIASLFQGTLSTIPMPSARQMASYSRTVYECSPIKQGDPEAVTSRPPAESNNPIPAKVGDPSPITHCIYIIKENRTYDQVFGDLPQGNGEPSLCLFPEKITPNHHALVKEFVLLDNFYAEAEVSADGHEWSMGAYATDFVERTWPLGYRGDRRVPYTAEGVFNIAKPAGGYLWDRAAAKGVTYRSLRRVHRQRPHAR